MDTLWIGNGRLVLPQRVLENGSVLIEDGRIIEIGHPCPRNVQRADADGGYILPGFIDLHVHGGGGADAMDATVQALQTMARTHAAHGTTALVPTTMTCEDALLERVIDRFLEARSATAEQRRENAAGLKTVRSCWDCIWRDRFLQRPPGEHSPSYASACLTRPCWKGFCGARRAISFDGMPLRSLSRWSYLLR